MSYYYDFEGFARPKKTIPQNVPYDTWAPQMWSQFTDIGNNFKSSQDFSSQVHNLINQIPCPECKTDGESYVKTNPPENIQSKAQAQGWVTAYHNHVNQLSASKKGWGFARGGAGGGPGGGAGGTSDYPTTLTADRGGGGISGSWDDNGPRRMGWAGETAAQRIGLPDTTTDTHRYPGGRGGVNGGPGETGGGIAGGQGGGGVAGGGVGGKGGDPGIPGGRIGNTPNSGGGDRQSGAWPGGYGEKWYSIMWAELHDLAYDFDPEFFAEDIRNKIEEIPEENERCYQNSQEFMSKYPPEYVRTRDQALYWMCRFHNHASLDAGNGLVDCELDPEGYGYVSGHDDYARDFFYGGGSRGGGGSQGGGGGRRGGRKKGRHGGGRGGGGMRQGGGGMGPMGGMPGQGGYAKGLTGGQRVPTSRNAPYCRGNLVEADGILYCDTREHPGSKKPTFPSNEKIPNSQWLKEKHITGAEREVDRSQRIAIA